MSKLTDLLRTVRVFNDWEFFDGSTGNPDSQVYIVYRAETGRSPFTSRAFVYRTGYKTDPKAHWSDYGSKTFTPFDSLREDRVEGESNRALCIRAAQEWAGPRYGITEWARTPFGGWGDAAFVKARLEQLKQQVKEKAAQVAAEENNE